MSRSPVIHDRDGTPGTVESADDGRLRVLLADGVALDVPAELATLSDDGSYQAHVAFRDLLTADRDLPAGETVTLTEAAERLVVDTAVRETGRVRAAVVTETHEEAVDLAGWRETVEVERVPVDRVVEAVEPPRQEGDVTVVPVYEEVLVVQKQLVLREEVRLVPRRTPTTASERVPLRRQRVDIERLPPRDAGDADG